MDKRILAVLPLILLVAGPAFAQRLPTIVSPEHYDLKFSVDLPQARFEGTETIHVQVHEATPRIVLNAADITFHEVTISSGDATQTATVALNANDQTATLTVPKPLGVGPADVHISYTGILNDKLRGFYLSKTKTRAYAVTQFESTDARRAFPCFDEPAFKATFAVTLVLDRGDTAISNGKLVSDTGGPTPTRHTMVFTPSPKMSSYLVAMAIGNFQCLTGAADGIPIRVCATPDKKELGQIALESAERILSFYNTYYAIKYPFGKLDILAVPDFAAGAMENTAAIFYRETDLLADTKSASIGTRKTIASVLAHEMAHQWFGDLVTMAWWDDIWLNEGFATWMANNPLKAMHPDWNVPVDEELENQMALSLDALKATRPIHSRGRHTSANRRGVRRDRIPKRRRCPENDRELCRPRHISKGRECIPSGARLRQCHGTRFLDGDRGGLRQTDRHHHADVRESAGRAAGGRGGDLHQRTVAADADPAAFHARPGRTGAIV